ncbi:hypothetical protein [Methylobacterium sp. J-070]|uniref:hypothetical protein n=1 Tax=Methylobacterium sp. J-070 TaxID=2836650 RepID=UPI001FBB6620|nr:hypothetical protein [Methylobacterium sp. J-070]MCJ2054166.1 hypothetical protein [Methylobacterium sp. J-070]
MLRDGVVMAALVRLISSSGLSDMWQIELLDEMPAAQRPAPFTSQWRTFGSRPAALEWLGIPEPDTGTAG